MNFFAFEKFVFHRFKAEPFIKRNIFRILRFKPKLIAERNKLFNSAFYKRRAYSLSLVVFVNKDGRNQQRFFSKTFWSRWLNTLSVLISEMLYTHRKTQFGHLRKSNIV